MANTAISKTTPANLSETKPGATQVAMEYATYSPRVDLYETDTEMVLHCDLPGVKAGDVELRFDRGILSVHGKVQPRPQLGDEVSFEYGMGDFHRTFSIPVEIDSSKLSAECKLGVLTVHMPKHERAKPQKITVNPG